MTSSSHDQVTVTSFPAVVSLNFTLGTLARQAEIGVWVHAPRALAEVRGYYLRKKNSRLYMQNPTI